MRSEYHASSALTCFPPPPCCPDDRYPRRQKWKAQKQGGGEAAHCTDTEVEAGPSGSATSEGSEASGIEHPACRSELDLLCQVIVPEQSPNIGAPSAREKPPIASTDHDCKSLLRPHMGFVLPPRLLLA